MNPRHIALAFAVFRFGLYLIISRAYGFHADELYYIALSDHLQPAYADVPGFTPFIARVAETLFGDSLTAYRVLPALAAGLAVYITGLLTIRLGGKIWATTLSCTAVLFSPAFLATGYFLQPVVFEQVIWIGLVYLFIRHHSTGDSKYLFGFAGLAAVGFYNKYTILIYLIGLLFGMFCYHRDYYVRYGVQWLYSIGVFIMLLIPLIWWQVANHLPALTYLKYYQSVGPTFDFSDFFIQLIFSNGPSLVIWAAAFIAIAWRKKWIRYRFPIVAALFSVITILLLHGKSYYLLGIFPPLFAIGACYLELLLRKKNAAKLILMAFLTVPTLIAAPLILPILSLPLTKYYIHLMLEFTPIRGPVTWDDRKVHDLPQFYADMSGWNELVSTVTEASRIMSSQTGHPPLILVDNYGIHGALISLGSHEMATSIIAPNDFAAAQSPLELPDDHLIVLTKTSNNDMIKYSSEFTVLGEIKNSDAHIAGLHIYYLKNVRPAFKKYYRELRRDFLGEK
ncbi:MAG: glycosyltransferase family 39 protein [Mucilaginibacter polytrichastri]|nr:glycosyltransferase family 39 protein [Mucilaginibacter polytrichastri]